MKSASTTVQLHFLLLVPAQAVQFPLRLVVVYQTVEYLDIGMALVSCVIRPASMVAEIWQIAAVYVTIYCAVSARTMSIVRLVLMGRRVLKDCATVW